MNRNRHLSTKTYGEAHVQPHNKSEYATKTKETQRMSRKWKKGTPNGIRVKGGVENVV